MYILGGGGTDMRTKDSYLMLIHQILRLLAMELRMRDDMTRLQAECEGMKLSGRDAAECEEELRKIRSTLAAIAKTHNDLIDLLKERMALRQEMRHEPVGNAGYFHQMIASERLAGTKDAIGSIIRQ